MEFGRTMKMRLTLISVMIMAFSLVCNSSAASTHHLHQDLHTGKERRAETPLYTAAGQPHGITMRVTDDHVVLDNGILELTLSNPAGDVSGIRYGGLDNFLEIHNHENNRGYLNVMMGKGNEGKLTWLRGTTFKVIVHNENQTEVSFSSKWNSSNGDSPFPINFDRRYILLRNYSGFYMYNILEREDGWEEGHIDQITAIFKLQRDRFHYMAVSDELQTLMPLPYDRDTGEKLDYKEAVLVRKSIDPNHYVQVDDKYQFTYDHKDSMVHGWISSEPHVGFWMITPSSEFQSGGPFKQELLSHTGPTTLAVFLGGHYVGGKTSMVFQDGEPWKKVYGPVFVYLNSASSGDNNTKILWEDAKNQMVQEVQSWPYEFPLSHDYMKSDQRGSLEGRLLVHDDGYMRGASLTNASNAWIGLAAPGEAGSWQEESKGYQFWSQADQKGKFIINGVREGNYSLYATVPGFIGNYKYSHDITITAGSHVKLDNIVFEPLRTGPTLWEIGIPDRTAAEFYIPEPSKKFMNQIFTHDRKIKYRQYGLWERYTDLYPNHDLVFTIGVSNYTKDWFFAHVPRKLKEGIFEPTTWQIKFMLKNLIPLESYTLRIALASASYAELQVRFNNQDKLRPHFTTRRIGKDNAIARHGIHGLYRLYNVDVPSNLLRPGENTIYLTQSRSLTKFDGLMYDYIRLEGPSMT